MNLKVLLVRGISSPQSTRIIANKKTSLFNDYGLLQGAFKTIF